MSIITTTGEQRPTQTDFVILSKTPEELCPFMVMFLLANGIFPWHEKDDCTLWWSLDPRCVILPANVHVSNRLSRTIRQKKYRVSADTSFEQVVRRCADSRSVTWISERMIQVMTQLHQLGHAHSVETWEGDLLVGGLYGVAIGQVFFGESMFSIRPDASKVALVRLGQVLTGMGFVLIDCQLGNPHLKRMGAEFIPRQVFLRTVGRWVNGNRELGNWTKFFVQ